MQAQSAHTAYLVLGNGIKVFYREAGDKTKPTILLLHGFPSSSHQYRNLIPQLAHDYHVLAPDLPGFGFTTIPDYLKFNYTFASIAETVAQVLDALSIRRFAVYVFDYGAPTGLRLALQRPEAITAIITQNGNAYEDGLGDFWNPLRKYWTATGTEEAEIREALRQGATTYESIKHQYEDGVPSDLLSSIDPVSYTLDSALIELRPGNADIQLDLLKDYATNVDLYPQFHEYLRKSQVPLLAIWGKNDMFFIPPGAEAFKRDLPDAQVEFVDAGHFALETHGQVIGAKMLAFLKEKSI